MMFGVREALCRSTYPDAKPLFLRPRPGDPVVGRLVGQRLVGALRSPSPLVPRRLRRGRGPELEVGVQKRAEGQRGDIAEPDMGFGHAAARSPPAASLRPIGSRVARATLAGGQVRNLSLKHAPLPSSLGVPLAQPERAAQPARGRKEPDTLGGGLKGPARPARYSMGCGASSSPHVRGGGARGPIGPWWREGGAQRRLHNTLRRCERREHSTWRICVRMCSCPALWTWDVLRKLRRLAGEAQAQHSHHRDSRQSGRARCSYTRDGRSLVPIGAQKTHVGM